MTERPPQEDHQTDWWFIAWCEDCDHRYLDLILAARAVGLDQTRVSPQMKQPFSDADARNTWAMQHSASTPKGTHKVKVWTEDRLTHERVAPGAIITEKLTIEPGQARIAINSEDE